LKLTANTFLRLLLKLHSLSGKNMAKKKQHKTSYVDWLGVRVLYKPKPVGIEYLDGLVCVSV